MRTIRIRKFAVKAKNVAIKIKKKQCLGVRRLGTDLSKLNAWQSEIFKSFGRKGLLKRSRKVFDICLESEKYFGFVIDELRAYAYYKITMFTTQ